jgi:hypothetical protein
MPQAGICLDERPPHFCPLGALAAEDHGDGWGDRGSFGETGCFELAVLPDAQMPAGEAVLGARLGYTRLHEH